MFQFNRTVLFSSPAPVSYLFRHVRWKQRSKPDALPIPLPKHRVDSDRTKKKSQFSLQFQTKTQAQFFTHLPSAGPGSKSADLWFDQERRQRLRSASQELRSSTTEIHVDRAEPQDCGHNEVGRSNLVYVPKLGMWHHRLVARELRDWTEEDSLWR